MPKSIVNVEKKAIQYSTGISKYIEKIAKKKGMSVREFIKHKYQIIWGV